MAAPVVCDDAEAVLREEQHLPVPCVRIQRPAVGERDDRTFPPILVIDLGAVLGGDSAHDSSCYFLIVPLAVWLFAGGLARWSFGVLRSLSSCCAYNSGIVGSCQWAEQGICAVLEWVS